MRKFDLAKLSAKNLKGKWTVLPLLGIAVASFCLCFAGTIFTTVQYGKAQPYELSVAPGSSGISDSVIIEISNISDVTAATAVLELQAILTSDEYTAEFTMTGIGNAYIENGCKEGIIFPDDSAMPYIVLNEAALRQLEAGEDKKGYSNEAESSFDQSKEPDVNWIGTGVTVQIGKDTKPIVAKICGILRDNVDEEQAPAAYISMTTAKDLLIGSGQSSEYTGALVRVTNISCADAISQEISALGLSVSNPTEKLQVGWDAKLKEMFYLIVISIFCLLCVIALMAAWRRVSHLENADVYRMLIWIGMRRRDIRHMFSLYSVMISFIGVMAGILVSVVLPSFLKSGGITESIYMLPVPFWATIFSAGVCMVSGSIPLLFEFKGADHY